MTTWNPSDKSAGVSLSNGNLTAVIASGTGDQGARSTTSKTSGKFVFEVTFNQVGASVADTGAGIGLSGATFPGLGSNASSGAMIYVNGGNIWVNGTRVFTGGNWSSSAVLMVA